MGKQSIRIAVTAAVILLLLLVLGSITFIYSGAYNVAATAAHTGIVRWALNTTQKRSVAVRADDIAVPPALDQDALLHGFEHFREMCVVCHGAPGVDRGEFGQGLTPTPPELSQEAEEWTASELFWIIKHGIKLAGMPAFGRTHSDDEIWGIVSFLQRLARMSPPEYQQWVDQYASGEAESTSAGHDNPAGTPSHSH